MSVVKFKPVWELSKTKKIAYNCGFNVGLLEGHRRAEETLRAKQVTLDERKQEIAVLSNVVQAGSAIVECMTKAMLSFNRNK